MIALFRSEVLRMSSRRLVRVFIVAGVIAILIASVIVAFKSHRASPSDRAQAHAQYEQSLKDCMSGNYTGSKMTAQECIDSGYVATQSDYLYSIANEYTTENLARVFEHTALLMVVMAMVIGASSIGAEWGYGTVTTLLAWEPKRVRVLLVRAVVVILTVAIVAFALQLLLSLSLYGVASLRGSTAGSNGAWLHHVLAAMGRVTLVAAIVSVIALSVATIGRSTAAALGALVAYLAIFESILRGFRPLVTPWLLASSVVTYITGHSTELFVPPGRSIIISTTHSLAVSLAYCLILLVLALIFFRNRDVN